MTVPVDESDQAEKVPNHVNDAHPSDLHDQPAEQVDVHFDDKELNLKLMTRISLILQELWKKFRRALHQWTSENQ